MKRLARLVAEQDGLRELFSHYDESLSAASKQGVVREICRIADAIHRTRIELVIPGLRAAGVDRGSLEGAVIASDLGQMILGELHISDPADPRYDALVRALERTLLSLWDVEEGRGGWWADAALTGDRHVSLDVAVSLRLRKLVEGCLPDAWRPCPPVGFRPCGP